MESEAMESEAMESEAMESEAMESEAMNYSLYDFVEHAWTHRKHEWEEITSERINLVDMSSIEETCLYIRFETLRYGKVSVRTSFEDGIADNCVIVHYIDEDDVVMMCQMDMPKIIPFKLPENFGQEGNHDSICSICLESNTDGLVVKLECNHYYHKECVRDWLESNKTCPLCRTKISKEFNSKENNPV